MGNNRERGHRFERKIKKILSEFFPKIKTSREESRALDNLGIDFAFTDSFAFQCKTSVHRVDYTSLIDTMSSVEGVRVPVVLHQLTEKKGEKFYVVEEYAILKMEDFIALLRDSKAKLDR